MNWKMLCTVLLSIIATLALLSPAFYKDINPNSVMKFFKGQIVESILNRRIGQVIRLDWRSESYLVRFNLGESFEIVRMQECELKAHGE